LKMGYVEYKGIGDILVYIEERESWSTFGLGAQQATKVAYWRSVKKSIVRAQATKVAY
jgi:hypothetical protein